jgi:PAS domain S-box-containing protein
VLDNDALGNYPPPRSRAVTLVYFVLVSAIIISLTISYRSKKSASRSLARQAALSRIGGLAQDLRNVGWLSIAGREVTSESEVRVQDARRQLADNTNFLRVQTESGKSVDLLNQTLSYYSQSVDSQWQLIRSGKFEEARRVDFEQISPETELVQQEIRDAIAPEGKVAGTATTRSQLEAVTAGFLGFTTIIIAALRFHRRQQFITLQQVSLLRSEDRFRTLTEQSADIVLITDLGGILKYVSPSVKTALAAESSTLVGKSLADIVHPEDVRHLGQLLSVAKKQGLSLEFRLRHSDTRWLDFECSIRNLSDHENINGLVVNAHDITDRKKMQEHQTQERQAKRAEQLRVVHVTMRTVQDIVNNCLNQIQLLRLDAEGFVPEESLRLFDEAIQDTTTRLKELGNLQVFAEKQMAIGSGLDVTAPIGVV